MNKAIKKEVFLKDGKKWILDHTTAREDIIFNDLATYLASKYINRCDWIKSIKRVNHFDNVTYTIYQTNDVKVIITVIE